MQIRESNQRQIGYHLLLLTQVNPRLVNYTTILRKMLSLLETMKIIIYHSIRVPYFKYKPHQLYENLATDYVPRWR